MFVGPLTIFIVWVYAFRDAHGLNLSAEMLWRHHVNEATYEVVKNMDTL